MAVRWTVTAEDYGQATVTPSATTRDFLLNALKEVGVQEKQNVKRVLEYWDTLPVLRDNNGITEQNVGPWGGAFLSYVSQKAGVAPPSLGAGYFAWPAWGRAVAPADVRPGMIVLFATKVIPETTGQFVGGVFLRNRADCTEIITGNIVDRIVIACLALPIASARAPN